MLKPTASIVIVMMLVGSAILFVAGTDARGYFRAGSLDPNSVQSDRFRNRWYSKQLRAMGEPALEPAKGQRAYRFTWLRTFHHPVAVRMVATNDRFALFATELDGAGGYAPGTVLRKTSLELTSRQFSELEDLIRQSGFWRLPSHEETSGLDGSQWLIEGATDRYHVVDRWTPESGPIRTLGVRFLALAEWNCEKNELY